jgi:hypothetical protein
MMEQVQQELGNPGCILQLDYFIMFLTIWQWSAGLRQFGNLPEQTRLKL